ncbi:MAG TPA: hypothetical protein VLE89_03980 [Chlamydiales bacterium]|nr:hypothetical protein [Chlamydiales bacterium]
MIPEAANSSLSLAAMSSESPKESGIASSNGVTSHEHGAGTNGKKSENPESAPPTLDLSMAGNSLSPSEVAWGKDTQEDIAKALANHPEWAQEIKGKQKADSSVEKKQQEVKSPVLRPPTPGEVVVGTQRLQQCSPTARKLLLLHMISTLWPNIRQGGKITSGILNDNLPDLNVLKDSITSGIKNLEDLVAPFNLEIVKMPKGCGDFFKPLRPNLCFPTLDNEEALSSKQIKAARKGQKPTGNLYRTRVSGIVSAMHAKGQTLPHQMIAGLLFKGPLKTPTTYGFVFQAGKFHLIDLKNGYISIHKFDGEGTFTNHFMHIEPIPLKDRKSRCWMAPLSLVESK